MQLVITGAANGIGAAVTEAALRAGHEVVAADLDLDALQARWQDAVSVRCEPLDVRQSASWEQLIQRTHDAGISADVLINVAGVLRSGQAGRLTEADIDLMLDVNVKGVMLGSNAFAADMIPRGHGHIVNVGSIASLYATPGTTVYAASKFAVRGFSIAAAGDLRPHGIAVTLVGPGPVKTAMLEQQRGDHDAALTFSGARALRPAEVADAIIGPVLEKRPLEYYLPYHEGILGKLCNMLPGFFLSQVDRARSRGEKHFSDQAFK